MSVDFTVVAAMARLANIGLEDSEVVELQGELNAILDLVDSLKELDLSGVEPMAHVVHSDGRMREDISEDVSFVSKEILSRVPVVKDGFFVCPSVIE